MDKQKELIVKLWDASGMLKGLTGKTSLGPGYVYAPYIPVELKTEIISLDKDNKFEEFYDENYS
jgi:hypothetical protein